jgi:hypothetical protein
MLRKTGSDVEQLKSSFEQWKRETVPSGELHEEASRKALTVGSFCCYHNTECVGEREEAFTRYDSRCDGIRRKVLAPGTCVLAQSIHRLCTCDR